MVFGGLHKNSFIDYPGKMSCVLFLSGCNFKCPYCHNPGLVENRTTCDTPIDENQVYRFLNRRKSFLDGVVISGGEPTLQKDILGLCEKIKTMGYPVKLDTNGSRPHIIKKLIQRELVDYIAMDIKTDPRGYSPLLKNGFHSNQILTSIWMIMESAPAYEFRTTCVKPLVTPGVIESICRTISGADLYILQQFRDTDVLEPDLYTDRRNRYQDHELDHLLSLAKPWVKECLVRNTG